MYKDIEWSRNVVSYGIGYFRYCATIFGTVRFFRIFGPPAPARIIIPPPDNFLRRPPPVRLRLPSADAPL